MVRTKQIISILLVILIVLLMTLGIAGASTQASDYLTQYTATLVPGDTTGRYYIYFDVLATKTSDSLGVSEIVIYRSDGTYITTISGSTNNGLICEKDFTHAGTYTHYGVSGNYYYAVVTIFAERDGGSDSREVTTNTIQVP